MLEIGESRVLLINETKSLAKNFFLLAPFFNGILDPQTSFSASDVNQSINQSINQSPNPGNRIV